MNPIPKLVRLRFRRQPGGQAFPVPSWDWQSLAGGISESGKSRLKKSGRVASNLVGCNDHPIDVDVLHSLYWHIRVSLPALGWPLLSSEYIHLGDVGILRRAF
jgi:hypothetical protein